MLGALDKLFPKWTQPMASVKSNSERTRLEVTWPDGSTDEYPARWLRFNCPCEACWDKHSYQRRMNDYPLLLIVSVDLQGDKTVKIEWDSGHVSEFSAEFLGNRSFQKEKVQQRLKLMMYDRTAPKFDKGGVQLVRLDFEKTARGDTSDFLKFYEHMQDYGACILTDTPADANESFFKDRKIMLRTSHYGDRWHVKTKPNHSNIAYTGVALGLHTDLAVLSKQPEIQFLHCIQASQSGGYSLISDAISAAERLRESHPDHFATLAQIPAEYVDVGTDNVGAFFLAQRRTVLELKSDGKTIDKVHLSAFGEANCLCLSIEEAERQLAAKQKFVELLIEGQIRFKLGPGDLMVLDNTRLTHGREAYTPSVDPQPRHLIGWYTDWEFLHSAARICRTESA